MSTIYNVFVTKDNVKNHLKGWKKTYGVVSDILSQSGFNWDSGRKMITVDDDNVWSEYAKTHSEASKYRFKTIVNWDDIVDLCAKDRATGYGAENADDANETMSIDEDNVSLSGIGGSFQDDSLKRKPNILLQQLHRTQKKWRYPKWLLQSKKWHLVWFQH
ncbi:uncharacterized protein LOC126795688 [Argentina anserina]|uniref:uncharacterized protein LOC126795688 n=1 Tax=Argentina anserina TaxID=57926 RepID=UPI0021763C1D|nr:uncharacterized protein LOC126795688 [Potentilla anserina]